MNLLKLFRKTNHVVKELVDPMIGRTVIRFITHGCQATIHEFDFIGIIVEITYPRLCNEKKFYKVEILKDTNGEKQDDGVFNEFREVPSWYCQNIGGDFFVVYD